MAVDGSRALAELDLNSSIGYFCSDPVTFGLRPRKPLSSHIYREKEPSAIRLHIAPVILRTPADALRRQIAKKTKISVATLISL